MVFRLQIVLSALVACASAIAPAYGYGGYGAAYHAPIATAYPALGYGSTYHGNAYHGALSAPIVKAAYPAYGAAYATYHH